MRGRTTVYLFKKAVGPDFCIEQRALFLYRNVLRLPEPQD